MAPTFGGCWSSRTGCATEALSRIGYPNSVYSRRGIYSHSLLNPSETNARLIGHLRRCPEGPACGAKGHWISGSERRGGSPFFCSLGGSVYCNELDCLTTQNPFPVTSLRPGRFLP